MQPKQPCNTLDALTGKEWVEEIARQCGTKPKVRSVGRGMLKLMGLFVPIMRELVEMMYQYEQDYVFSSAKFDQRFGKMATPYKKGIEEVLTKDYNFQNS